MNLRFGSKARLIALLISLLFHLLLLFLLTGSRVFDFSALSELKMDKIPEEKRIVFELVETSPEAETEEMIPETDLASDRKTKARDMNEQEYPDQDMPFAEGDLEIREPELEPERKSENQGSEEDIKELLGELDLAQLLKKPEKQTLDDLFSDTEQEKRQSHDNKLSSVRDYGGLSFNTYDWDFAPYMLAMKRKIQNKIKPPFAFTHMGIISGESVIRFVVARDGSLQEVSVIDSEGHETLTQTSQNAIEWSAPFMPLPGDFPEENLVVTAKFSYTIRK